MPSPLSSVFVPPPGPVEHSPVRWMLLVVILVMLCVVSRVVSVSVVSRAMQFVWWLVYVIVVMLV